MSSFTFGHSSSKQLATCHPVLQEILKRAILYTPMDFSILEGHRDEERQNRLKSEGKSKLSYPDSKHNKEDAAGRPESLAVDVAPYHASRPHYRWNETEDFYFLAGFIIGIGSPYAKRQGFRIRWGGDWDSDGDLHDQSFMDLGHLELVRAG